MFDPVDTACGSFSSFCWESSFDRVEDRLNRWVFAQSLSPRVALIAADGRLTRVIEVSSPAFQRNGGAVDPSAPLEQQMAWNEENSAIDHVFVFGDRIAVVHRIQMTRGRKRGTWVQYAIYLNVYTVDGKVVTVDRKLPDLPVGRDERYIYVVDYGAGGRRENAEGARIVAIDATS